MTTWEDLKIELQEALPPGTEEWLDLEDPNGPGPLLEATAHVLQEHGTDCVEALRRELVPLTAKVNMEVWERSLGFLGGRIAQSGDLERRRAQVISRLSEAGATTLELIRTVLQQYLQYADPSQIVILEVPRAALRALHTRVWTGAAAFGGGSTATITWQVRDDPKVSQGGAQVDLTFAAPVQLDTFFGALAGPGVLSGKSWLPLEIGRGQSTTVRLYAAEMAGASIWGAWTLTLPPNGAVGTVTRAELFVEAQGRYFDFQGKPRDGLGAAKGYWGVVADPALLGPGYDLPGAAAAIDHLTYACRRGALVHRPANQATVGAIPDWPTTIPDQVVPG